MIPLRTEDGRFGRAFDLRLLATLFERGQG